MDAVIDSRIGSASKRSQNQQVSNAFKLWFNTDPADDDNSHADHMAGLQDKVQQRAAGSGGKMAFAFQSASVRTITL